MDAILKNGKVISVDMDADSVEIFNCPKHLKQIKIMPIERPIELNMVCSICGTKLQKVIVRSFRMEPL